MAFLYTHINGSLGIVEGTEAKTAFFKSLNKRKHGVRVPIAIHHTSVDTACLYFSRKKAEAAVQATLAAFHYIQRYVTNRTHTPELLCSVFRPGKPLKFYMVVPRHTDSQWILNRNDSTQSEILECSQGDVAVTAMSETLYSLLTEFDIGYMTELVSDYIRNEQGQWIFKSIVSVALETQQKRVRGRPRTASTELKPKLSLKAKVVLPKPKPRSFLGVRVMAASSLVLERAAKDRASGDSQKPQRSLSISDIEQRLRGMHISQAPQLKEENMQGFGSFTVLTPYQKLSPACDRSGIKYERLMAQQLATVSEQYDNMRKSIQEFHDRRANPRRCVLYYPDSFWTEVASFVGHRLASDPKAFPMFVRMEAGKLCSLIRDFLAAMRQEGLCRPIPLSLLELTVELSIPRIDSGVFLTLLEEAFQASRMRVDEIKAAVEVYRDNLTTLLRLNWQRNFTTFLSKKILSEEFLFKVMNRSSASAGTEEEADKQVSLWPVKFEG